MTTAHLTNDTLAVRFTTGEKIAGLLRDMDVPLTAVRSAAVEPDGLEAASGIRAPGLALPGYSKIGTWRGGGRRVAVVARRGLPALRVELSGHRYTSLLIDVDDAATLASALTAAAGGSATSDVAITVPSGGHTLSGTLALPTGPGPHPAALLIPGSGPVDRNSDHRRMKLGITGQLADELARAGIASLRYDKRGVGASTGRWLAAGLDDNTDDAAAALTALTTRPEVDPRRVIVVGHSEGALLAASVVARGADVAGVVLLSPSATPGEELLLWQAEQIAPTLPTAVKLVLRLLRVDLVANVRASHAKIKATTTDTAWVGGRRVNAKWHRQFLAHDPRTDLERISVPTLAITGTKDLQVRPCDLLSVASWVRGPVQTELLADVTHVLRRQPGRPSLGAYRSEVRRPVEPALLDTVTTWAGSVLQQQLPRRA